MMRLHRFGINLIAAWVLLSMVPGDAETDLSSDTTTLPPASANHLPRWRGFNLLNMFHKEKEEPFDESEFKMIHDLGFNFVRIPMDYRIWVAYGDWYQFNENALKEVDRAVAFGQKYRIHVCLNFHRAPGYTVAKPPEEKSLWTDEEAQRVCARDWAMFARRYKGIPNENLSFDLLNEPPQMDGHAYARVVDILVKAIRKEDPNRLIITDGISAGYVPCPELIDLHVAQATRGYRPIELAFYHASWIPQTNWPVPTWPSSDASPASSYLYGPGKPWRSPLILKGTFPAGTQLSFAVEKVSMASHLVVSADGREIFDKSFQSGPESKEGEKVLYLPQYKTYQNIFAQRETVVLHSAASRIDLSNTEGDWLSLDAMTLRMGEEGPTYPVKFSKEWGQWQSVVEFNAGDSQAHATSGLRQSLWDNNIVPWKRLEAQGVGVFVGEWGCYNKTPHDVTLRWMEDNLINFKQAGWGWALWNLSGDFGVMDSNRPDVVYEDFEGHKLDRQMLELLQRY